MYLEMRSVEDDTHKAGGGRRCDGDGHNPAHEDPANCPPIRRPPVTVAKGDTDGGANDAHGGRDGDTVLRGEDDGDGGAKFHRETTGGRHECDAVSEDGHDVVAVCRETDDEHACTKDQSPDRDGSLGSRELAGVPDVEDDGEGTNGVGDVVGSVGEGGNAGGEDLEEGVEVLGVVGVLLGASVGFSNALGTFHDVTDDSPYHLSTLRAILTVMQIARLYSNLHYQCILLSLSLYTSVPQEVAGQATKALTW
ncbi:hypothetical protein NMY22_g6134 [Coprinellus aureogranulatus]|nr:hypothetical protein NMY22_g6134 [Coprinellus aureogranulatus]